MRRVVITALLFSLSIGVISCGSKSGTNTGKVIKSTSTSNNLTIEISSASGVLKHGNEEFFLTFNDSSGKPVDAGAVAVNFYMPSMGTMPAMNKAVTLTTTGTPGIYQGKTDLEMAGEWQAQITYEGPAGTGKATMPITAQ